GDPDGHGAPERPRLPRQPSGDRDPRPHRRKAVDRSQPQVAHPREALEVGIDDEAHDRDRPEPADDRVELEARGEVQRERERAERRHLYTREPARWELTGG